MVSMLAFFASCDKEDDAKPSDDDDDGVELSEENIEGYWQLDKVEEDGDEVDFEEYQEGLENEFYFFDGNSDVTAIQVFDGEYYSAEGEWSLDDETIVLEIDGGENEAEVVSISEDKIEVETEEGFILTYIRIDEEDFQEALDQVDGSTDPTDPTPGDGSVTADVDGVTFDAEDVMVEQETDYVGIYAFDGNKLLYIEYDPTLVEPNATYDLDDEVFYVVYAFDFDPTNPNPDLSKIYSGISGQVTVSDITSGSIEATFDFVGANDNADEIEVLNGQLNVTF